MSASNGKLKRFLVNLSLVGMGFVIAFVALEVVLQFLPVNGASKRLAVNADHPVLRYQPNRTFNWSTEWNFRQVNQVHVNNFGFVNTQDYDTASATPLLAVVGDSYVEAPMVPFEATYGGRLAAHLGTAARVYTFGISGAPLSQYLAYSDYARQTFKPQALVISVIGNDFDQSLARYNQREGHHLFAPDAQGALQLTRVDYIPSASKQFLRNFALARYLVGNIQVERLLAQWRYGDTEETAAARYVGNTFAQADSARVTASKRAVEAFFDELPGRSGLPPSQVLFVVDAMRPHIYEAEHRALAEGSFFDLMRRTFMAQATARGYGVIDMQQVFDARYQAEGQRFEWPHDNHWNAYGHEVVYESIVQSGFLARLTQQ